MVTETQFEFDNELKDPINGEVHAYYWGKNRFALKETGQAWLVTDSPVNLRGDINAQLHQLVEQGSVDSL